MSENKKLTKNIVALIIVQFSNYIAPLLVLPYLTRVLSIDQFGIVVLSFSVCSLALIMTDFGFALSASYWITKNRDNKVKAMKYIGAVFGAKIILATISISLVLFYLITFKNEYSQNNLLILGIVLTVLFQAFQSVWFFQGIEKMKNVTICMVTSKIIYVVLILLFVKKSDDSDIVLICLAISSLIASGLGVIRIFKEGYGILRPTVREIMEVLASSFTFFLSRAAVGIYTSASTFIVGSFSGLQQAAMYSSAEKLYQAGQSASSPLSQALFPYLARSRNTNTLMKILLFLLPVMIIGVGLCIYFSREIIILIYGADYQDAAPILRVFLLTSIFTFLSVNLGYPAFAIYDRLALVNISVYIAAALHLLCLAGLYVSGSISALNIAICVCVVEFFVLALRFSMFIYIRDKSNGN